MKELINLRKLSMSKFKLGDISNRLLILFLILFFGLRIYAQVDPNAVKWQELFVPKGDYKVGIWPNPDYWGNPQKLKKLRSHFGFSQVLTKPLETTELYDNAISAGYENSDIVFQMQPKYGNPDFIYSLYPEVGGYYIDEPGDDDIPMDWFNKIVSLTNQNTDSSQIMISGFKRNGDFRKFGNLSDVVMFSSYKHWWEIFGLWLSCCPEDQDQRPDWENMASMFGAKFSTSWVGAHRDENEYDDLFGKARNLNLNGLWLYAQLLNGSESYLEANFTKFTKAGVKWNYLAIEYQAYREIAFPNLSIDIQYLGRPFDNIPAIVQFDDYKFENYIVSNDRVEDYFAFRTITAGYNSYFIVNSNKQSSLNAPAEVRLGPGFEARKGSSFNAFIGP